ncbi:MAG: TetR/AcrR family transcriptional regulator [Oscillospiraceae bacterium]|nr:TetR/AcrR family transcriptional regulator [Oscillospiraceae bacterium]
MPPKVRITKEDIIHTAVDLVRQQGESSVNARTVAAMLNCSTQPVFSNFATMEELRRATLQQIHQIYQDYIQREVSSAVYPAYKASGMAYIRFAKEEKELFKMLFMRDRSGEPLPNEWDMGENIEKIVRNSTGLEGSIMQLFHLEMWAYVHGIAVMFATGFLDLEWDLVSKMLSDAYMGMRKQYGME